MVSMAIAIMMGMSVNLNLETNRPTESPVYAYAFMGTVVHVYDYEGTRCA